MSAPPSNGRVTVVVPTYNRAPQLPRCLDSILTQTAADRCDIVVVDDGSTDETPDVVRRYMDRITYIRQANAGASVARNTGIAAIRNEFVAFLDSDDAWEPEKTALQLDAMRRFPEAVFVSSRITRVEPDGERIVSERPDIPIDQPFDAAPHVFRECFTSTIVTMVRATRMPGTDWFHPDLRSCEDYHLWVRLACRGPAVFLDESLATYWRDARDTLMRDMTSVLQTEVHARMLLRELVHERPDCRPAWHEGMNRCLAALRDQAYSTGHYSTAAGAGARLLLRNPVGRAMWEWRRTLSAAYRAVM